MTRQRPPVGATKAEVRDAVMVWDPLPEWTATADELAAAARAAQRKTVLAFTLTLIVACASGAKFLYLNTQPSPDYTLTALGGFAAVSLLGWALQARSEATGARTLAAAASAQARAGCAGERWRIRRRAHPVRRRTLAALCVLVAVLVSLAQMGEDMYSGPARVAPVPAPDYWRSLLILTLIWALCFELLVLLLARPTRLVRVRDDDAARGQSDPVGPR
jgi:hypothetical protein